MDVLFDSQNLDALVNEVQLEADGQKVKKESKEKLDELVNGFLILEIFEGNYYILFSNHALKDSLKYAQDELLIPVVNWIYNADVPNAIKAFRETKSNGLYKDSYRFLDARANFQWMMGLHKYFERDGREYIAVIYSDIQDIMGLQTQLQADNERLEDIINSIPIGLAIFSVENEILNTYAVNDRLVEFSDEIGLFLDGKKRSWTKQQLSLLLDQNLFSFTLEEDIPLVKGMLEEAYKNGRGACNFRVRGSTEQNALYIHASCSSRRISQTRTNFYVCYSNVTKEVMNAMELRKSHEKVVDMHYHDDLAKVRNRNGFRKFMDGCNGSKVRNIGLVFADINGLKTINDSLGHRYGDEMIARFATILRGYFDAESIYRISGDEFIVVVEHVSEARFRNTMSRLVEEVNAAESLASIGYIWKSSCTDVNEMVSSAEQLMYVEKQRYYASAIDRESKHRPRLINLLLEELKQGRYEMYLQPKANITGTRIVGAEALVRKFDADHNIIFPDKFIPQLEKSKLISTLDYYMLEQTCRLLQRWEKEQRELIRISVNMSRITLAENNFVENVNEICDRHGVDKKYIELEITESSATMDHRKLCDEVRSLKNYGFTISLDDMGTDYAGLKLMLMEGIDVVKIDRSFVTEMEKDHNGEVLVKHLISMSHDMKLSCIAEGVEEDKQRAKLQEYGCDMYQGYLLSRPIPVDKFEALLEESQND